MTEAPPTYITEADQLMGWDKPKEIIHEVSGYTPMFDVLVAKYADPITPLVFGKAWRFCQMEDGVCKASLGTMAKELGLDESTVSRHLKILVSDGFLRDLTPDLKNKPHIYADTGRIVMRTSTTAGFAHSKAESPHLAQSKASLAHSKAAPAQNAMTRVFKKDSEEREKEPALDFEKMTVSEAQRLPTLRLYHEAAQYFPGSLSWEMVDRTIRENGLTFERIRAAAIAWVMAGFKEGNIKGILEWAVIGIPEKYRSRQIGAIAQSDAPLDNQQILQKLLSQRGANHG